MTPPEEPKEVLLDADFLVYRVGFASEDDEEQYARARLTEFLTDIVYFHLKADDYKAYITGKNNFRNDIAVTVEYKSNRKNSRKPKHFAALRDQLVKLGAEVVDGQEADDAVAIQATLGNYWIVSPDKDLDQIPGWHYSPVRGEKYYVDEFTGLKNFYTQVLTGDSVDAIPGLARVGPVKAAKYLKYCRTEEELCSAAWEAYKERKHTQEYFLEQGRLLWLRRDVGQVWNPPIDLCSS